MQAPLACRISLRLRSSSRVTSVRSRCRSPRPRDSLSRSSPRELGSRPDTRLQPDTNIFIRS